VCSTGTSTTLSAPDAVYLNLAELVAKSFVVFDGDAARYRLLEPIRFFARERLDETGDLHTLAQAHAVWVLQISRAALAPQMLGSAVVRAPFRAELDNVQAALAFCETADPGTFMRIVAALGHTWFQSDWRRGRAAADIAVRLAEGASDRLRAAVLLSRGIVEQRNNYHVSAPWLEQARTMYTEMGDPLGQAWAAFFLGRARHFDDDAAVEALTLEAMELFRSLDLRICEAWCQINLSALETTREEYEAARARLESALAIVTELGDDGLRGQILDELGANAFHRGDLVGAQSILRRSTAIQRGLEDEYNVTATLCVAALVDITLGDLDEAYDQIGEVLAIAVRDDDDWLLRESLLVLAVLYQERGEIDDARRVLAATEWDVDPPEYMMDLTRSVVVRSLTALAPIVDTAADAAREGRATGRLATAHTVLANRRTAT
jgi:tetratricopeptide (TPR) repeat protein